MKLGVLFSGGKDSVYATYLAKKGGYEISCLITLASKNKDSYMFHTPAIEKTKVQAEVMGLPLVLVETEGKKEKELGDLKKAISEAVEKFGIEGVVTGAIASVYQASRVQKICDELGLVCFNPLWQKNEEEYLRELVREGFEVVLVGVFAYPFDESWILRRIDKGFIDEVLKLKDKFKIHVAGEGGEFESFVVNCPLYSRPLNVKLKNVLSEGENSFRAEVEVK